MSENIINLLYNYLSSILSPHVHPQGLRATMLTQKY
jgi:hypothetical protein